MLVSMKITLTMSLLGARSLSRWILLRGSDTLPRPSCASSAWMPTLFTEAGGPDTPPVLPSRKAASSLVRARIVRNISSSVQNTSRAIRKGWKDVRSFGSQKVIHSPPIKFLLRKYFQSILVLRTKVSQSQFQDRPQMTTLG